VKSPQLLPLRQPSTVIACIRGRVAMGLGLAIVARVAEAQRIDLTFAIEAGRATVTLRFAPRPYSGSAFFETVKTLYDIDFAQLITEKLYQLFLKLL
jgi:hypothetical protein